MAIKPSYEELEQRVNKFEEGARKHEQTEEALRESEERFRNFLDNLGDAAYEADTSGNVTYANKMAEIITGVPLKNIIGNPFLPLFTEESQKIALDVYQRTLNGESPEYELTFVNGKICHFKNEPLTNENGKIIGLIGIARDVTERRRAEEALRASEAKYRILVEQIPAITYIAALDKVSTTLYVSPQIEEILGFKPNEWKEGKDIWFNQLSPDDRKRVLAEVAACHKNEDPFISEYRMITRDGRVIWIHDEAVIVKDDDGTPVCLQGLMFDITERVHEKKALRKAQDELERRVEERTAQLAKANEKLQQENQDRKQLEIALRESEKQYRQLVETMNQGFSMVDENEVRIYANKKLCEMVGYEFDELVGVPANKILDESNKKLFEEQFAKRKKGQTGAYEITLTRKDGQKVPTIVSPRPVFDETGNFKGSFSVITDVTELKRTQQALKQREQEMEMQTANLEEANAALRVLLKRREEDKKELEEKVLFNMGELVEPYLEKLKNSELDGRQKAFLDILESNLNDIISPFSRNLYFSQLNLTPAEMQIAGLIRQNKTTKEIASLLNLSSRTVETHRKNIRKKLGLTDRKANLRTKLLSLQ